MSIMYDPLSQSYGFSSSHVPLWQLNDKEGWALKNWCFQIVVLEKTLESPLDSKEIKSVNPRGNQPWIFIRRTNAESEAPILWTPDAKSQLIGKAPDTGKDWGLGAAEDEMVGWIASLTWWTWIWANSDGCWRTGEPGVLQSVGSQRVRCNLVTEQQNKGWMNPQKPLLWIINHISSSCFKFSRADWGRLICVIPLPLACLIDVCTNGSWPTVGRRNLRRRLATSPVISVLRSSWGSDTGK